jgi:hypothetical protein
LKAAAVVLAHEVAEVFVVAQRGARRPHPATGRPARRRTTRNPEQAGADPAQTTRINAGQP